MIEVECEKCNNRFWVKGHTATGGWDDPDEVVTDLECDDVLCQCLQDGEPFSVTDESHETFDDDVI